MNDHQAGYYIGTIGYSYSDWRNVFYPPHLDAQKYLSYYSRVFNSVEIDSTFYGIPRESTIKRWVVSTRPGFLFSLKAPRLITHDLNLQNAQGLMREFINAVQLLGDRLGVILLQFPPSFDASKIKQLEKFIKQLPPEHRFAIEIRNQSWYTLEKELSVLFMEYHIAWAATQYPNLPEIIHLTTNFIYIRWIGKHGSYKIHNEERIDRTPDLLRWLVKIDEVKNQTIDVFGYLNNDYAGYAVGTALRFMKLSGMHTDLINQPKQTSFL